MEVRSKQARLEQPDPQHVDKRQYVSDFFQDAFRYTADLVYVNGTGYDLCCPGHRAELLANVPGMSASDIDGLYDSILTSERIEGTHLKAWVFHRRTLGIRQERD